MISNVKICYPSDLGTANTANSHLYYNTHRKKSVISLINSFIELNYEVVRANDNNRYAERRDIKVVNVGLVAFFSNYELAISSRKPLEEITHAFLARLLYKSIAAMKDAMIYLLDSTIAVKGDNRN